MAAPELMMLDIQEAEQTAAEDLLSSLTHSTEHYHAVKAKLGRTVGQLTLETILVPEPQLQALEI